ncbi:hypothetical protein [Cryptosporangium sp. NPDC051539]
MIEVPDTRARLDALCGGGVAQMVLRFGYGVAHAPTSRRPISEVVED